MDDGEVRERVLAALASATDAQLARRAAGLSLDPRLRANERVAPLFYQAYRPETREVAWTSLQADFDQLVPKLENWSAAALSNVARRFCDRERASQVEAFFEARIAKVPQAKQSLDQTLESIRLCAAYKDAQQASAISFFERLPRGFHRFPKSQRGLSTYPRAMSDPPGSVRFMREASDAELETIARAAWALEPPICRRELLREESAKLVDGVLTRCARGRGALEVAIGEGLLAIGVGDRLMRLKGYASVGDYAREELGIAASTAEKMARLARALRERPLLRDAVLAGDVTPRQAQTVLPVARGDAEVGWVEFARGQTVRALKAAVKAACGTEPEEDPEWERNSLALSPEARPVVEKALEIAGRLLGAISPKWQRVEVICQEYLGAHAAPDDAGAAGVLRGPVEDTLEPLMKHLEEETARWAFLDRIDPVLAPVAGTVDETDPWALDAALRELLGRRRRWDEVFGHLAMLFKMEGLWREAGFASFGQYCSERLGMAERTVEQRGALERRLWVLPTLRKAMREGRISYEKARLIAWQADDTTVEEFIGVAQSMTCIELRRRLEADEERQMCARGDFDFRAPRGVGALLSATLSAAREAEGRWLTPSECFQRAAQHFIDVWEEASKPRNTPRNRAMARDKGLCQVPGCSHAADDEHHVQFRSAGGTDDEWNQAGLCKPHHLRGVHLHYVRVYGRAPDQLVWVLGERAVRQANRITAAPTPLSGSSSAPPSSSPG